MDKKLTLLILAAGMGSRYGGLKQIDPVGPNGEIIIDYSMFDAVRAGFNKIVFIIRHYFENEFREKIGNKLEGIVETKYAYQELDSCLNGFTLPLDRQKPWGTGHAILTAESLINEPFAVINADDYYGSDSYRIMAEYLTQKTNFSSSEYAMVGYVLRNTLSEYGTVSRGICQHNADMYLTNITERTKIQKKADSAAFMDENGIEHGLQGDEIVSMNLWGFRPDIFRFLKEYFNEFLYLSGNDKKSEFYIPSAIDMLLRQNKKKVKILKSSDSWFGVTYPEDKKIAESCIRKLIEQGVYPKNLWCP